MTTTLTPDRELRGPLAWVAGVDHKRSALLAMVASFAFFGIVGALALNVLSAQTPRTTPRFGPADPVTIDDDTVADASAFEELELSEGFDLLANQFASPGDRTPRASSPKPPAPYRRRRYRG